MDIFQFKEFQVAQDRCAMKIGTDAVLLGAWTSLQYEPESILDIGAGTGILALQLAQRCDAETIDALEIDPEAYEQCVENFEASPWSDRLFCYHASLEEFVEEMDETYDLIISNPPFFNDHYKSADASRNLARFTDSLTFTDLIESVAQLLNKNGVFSVIIPKKEEEFFLSTAAQNQLYPKTICEVKGHATAESKRVLIALTFLNDIPQREVLIIEKARHVYTAEYINLVKDFYLKM